MPKGNRPLLRPAQWRVLERMAAGEDNAAIAQALGITLNTVTGHVSAIYQRLALVGRGRGLPETADRLGQSKRAAAIAWYLTVGRALREQEAGS